MWSIVNRRWYPLSSAAPLDDGVGNAFGSTDRHRIAVRRRNGSISAYSNILIYALLNISSTSVAVCSNTGEWRTTDMKNIRTSPNKDTAWSSRGYEYDVKDVLLHSSNNRLMIACFTASLPPSGRPSSSILTNEAKQPSKDRTIRTCVSGKPSAMLPPAFPPVPRVATSIEAIIYPTSTSGK